MIHTKHNLCIIYALSQALVDHHSKIEFDVSVKGQLLKCILIQRRSSLLNIAVHLLSQNCPGFNKEQ